MSTGTFHYNTKVLKSLKLLKDRHGVGLGFKSRLFQHNILHENEICPSSLDSTKNCKFHSNKGFPHRSTINKRTYTLFSY